MGMGKKGKDLERHVENSLKIESLCHKNSCALVEYLVGNQKVNGSRLTLCTA
jgi:hypothetical protein